MSVWDFHGAKIAELGQGRLVPGGYGIQKSITADGPETAPATAEPDKRPDAASAFLSGFLTTPKSKVKSALKGSVASIHSTAFGGAGPGSIDAAADRGSALQVRPPPFLSPPGPWAAGHASPTTKAEACARGGG